MSDSNYLQVPCPTCNQLVRERADGCYPKHRNPSSTEKRCESSDTPMQFRMLRTYR